MFRDTVEGTGIELEIEPGRVGSNRVTVSLEDRLGAPIISSEQGATDVRVLLTYLGADLGESAVSARPVGDGTYVVEESQISIAGVWQAELTVVRPDAFDARTAFQVRGGVDGGWVAARSSRRRPIRLGTLLGSRAGRAWGLCLRWWRCPWEGATFVKGRGCLTPGAAAFLVGVFLLFTGGSEQLRNPIAPTPESLAAGEAGYVQNCQVCHGTEGRGDGPGAPGLTPPPADLTIHVPLHPDRDLFRFIHDGIPGTAMAPLGARLSDNDIWNLVNYIKTLGR